MSFIAMQPSHILLVTTTLVVLGAMFVVHTDHADAANGGRTEIGESTVSPPPQSDDLQEGESELPWLFAVFFITWAAFFGYAFVMSRRQKEMKREIDALNRALVQRSAHKKEEESGRS